MSDRFGDLRSEFGRKRAVQRLQLLVEDHQQRLQDLHLIFHLADAPHDLFR